MKEFTKVLLRLGAIILVVITISLGAMLLRKAGDVAPSETTVASVAGY